MLIDFLSSFPDLGEDENRLALFHDRVLFDDGQQWHVIDGTGLYRHPDNAEGRAEDCDEDCVTVLGVTLCLDCFGNDPRAVETVIREFGRDGAATVEFRPPVQVYTAQVGGVYLAAPFGVAKGAVANRSPLDLFYQLGDSLEDPGYIKDVFGDLFYDVKELAKARIGCEGGIRETLAQFNTPETGFIRDLPDELIRGYTGEMQKYLAYCMSTS